MYKAKVPDRLLPNTDMIGTYDHEGAQMGLRDKFETVVVRNYLWNNHEMSMKPVSTLCVIVQHCVASYAKLEIMCINHNCM